MDALLANTGEALLLHGDPGVGKSAIAAATISRAGAAGATVLTTTGMPSETEVPYTSLQPLLWPVLDDADGLPAAQRAALDAALGLSSEPPKDPFRTGMAVLNLLGDAAERAPVVVVAGGRALAGRGHDRGARVRRAANRSGRDHHARHLARVDPARAARPAVAHAGAR